MSESKKVISKEHMDRMREMRSKAKNTKKVFVKNFSDAELDTYLRGVSDQYATAYKKAFSGTRSLKAIAKAKCLDCVGFDEPRTNVKECSIKI